ncbi:MAG: hypothetical protein GY716_00705 [bacterium]|nr:hypothetical protein [bacterium]
MQYAWHDLAGNLGVVAILAAYLLLQLGRLDPSDARFSILNGVGAALIIVSLLYDFNLSAMIVEVFWLLISLIGIGRWWARRTRYRDPASDIGP